MGFSLSGYAVDQLAKLLPAEERAELSLVEAINLARSDRGSTRQNYCKENTLSFGFMSSQIREDIHFSRPSRWQTEKE